MSNDASVRNAGASRTEDYHLLWPRRLAGVLTPRVRVGRVLHWTGLAAGAGFLAVGLLTMIFAQPGLFGALRLLSSACYGTGCVLAGRMARVLLARE